MTSTPNIPSFTGAHRSGGGGEATDPAATVPPLAVCVTHPAPGVAVVRAVGEIDLITAPDWSWYLAQASMQLAQQPAPTDPAARAAAAGGDRGADGTDGGRGAPRLVCDLTGVGFLGARGLGVLASLAEHTTRLGVELRLVADTGPARRTLELAGLDRTLAIGRDLLVAITAAFGPAR